MGSGLVFCIPIRAMIKLPHGPLSPFLDFENSAITISRKEVEHRTVQSIGL